jgi:hypothetical protein
VTPLASSAWVEREAGCLEVRVASGRDPLVPAGSPLLVVAFSNRCDGRTEVHFEGVSVRAETEDGSEEALTVFDPHKEIHPAWIEPHDSGAEAIELAPPPAAADHAIASFCVDLSRVSPTTVPVAPVCFRREADAFVPVGPTARAEDALGTVGASETQPYADAIAKEVSDVVGYRRRTRFGAGWEHGHTGDPVPRWATARRFASYDVGSLLGTPEGRQVGCLDVYVEPSTPPGRPKSVDLRLRFGNRCTRGLNLDFRELRVVAVAPDRSERAMTLYDPAAELRVYEIEGRNEGEMALQFDAPEGTPPGSRVCVDASRLVVGEPAVGVAPVCLARAPLAETDVDVVGHQFHPPDLSFRPFPWRFFMELGIGVQLVDFNGRNLTGTLADGRSFTVPGSTFGRAPVYQLDLRFGPFVSGPAYVGAWLRGGGAYFGALPAIDGGAGVALKPDVGVADMTLGGVAGYAFARSAAWRLRGEVGAGMRVFEIDVAPPGCAGTNDSCARSAWLIEPDVEPRLALDVWLNPWWSVSGYVTTDVFHLPSVGGGVAITLHTRAFDGVP